MGSGRVVVVGAGVVGLAHALTACEAGFAVTVLERDGRPLGASVRNFGTLWPIGCAPGPEREQALFGVARWRQVAAEAGFWCGTKGSLSLAYRAEAWNVLEEFAGGDAGFELLDAGDVRRRSPAVNPAGLRGGLFSGVETLVHPPSAIPALADYVRRRGVEIHYGAPVVKVNADHVETGCGRTLPFDRLVIAAGEEMRLFFPAAVAAARIQPCRLQMMRTVPQPRGFAVGPVLVGDLTLCHYPAFRGCPSTPRLRARLEAELPRHHRWGIHVIVAQHPDGSLTLGDSHEYGTDLAPDSLPEVDELILDALREFAVVPDLRIAAHWQGTYLKSTIGQTQVVLEPRDRVTMVTALGGLGMTLSWGIARNTVASWSDRRMES